MDFLTPLAPCGHTTKPWLKSAQELPVCTSILSEKGVKNADMNWGSEQTLKVQPQVSLPPQVTPTVTLMDPDHGNRSEYGLCICISKWVWSNQKEWLFRPTCNISNGCLDAYEVKVNIGIFKYQEKVKLISQFQRFFKFFNGLLVFSSFPSNNCKNMIKCLHPLGM